MTFDKCFFSQSVGDMCKVHKIRKGQECVGRPQKNLNESLKWSLLATMRWPKATKNSWHYQLRLFRYGESFWSGQIKKKQSKEKTFKTNISEYEAVSEWVTERVLRADKTPSTGLTMSDLDILVPNELWRSKFSSQSLGWR